MGAHQPTWQDEEWGIADAPADDWGRSPWQANARPAAQPKKRPVVALPGDAGGFSAQPRGTRGPGRKRRIKLPPVWLLINLIVLLVAGVAVAPRLLASQQTSCMWYTAGPSDTLWGLAHRFNVDVGTLASVNQLATPNHLYAGQQVCIPIAASVDAVVPIPAKRITPSPPATPTPATRSPGSVSGPAAFIAFALPYARRAHAATGWPVSVILAQWSLEHGWKLPGFTGYNFGNVGGLPGEPSIPGTQAAGSPSRFSYARTPEDGLRQYIKCARLHYYTGIAAAAKVSDNAAAVALGASPWDAGHYGGASDPGSSLLRLMRQYNLYQYD